MSFVSDSTRVENCGCLVEGIVKITRVVEGNSTVHPPTVRKKY